MAERKKEDVGSSQQEKKEDVGSQQTVDSRLKMDEQKKEEESSQKKTNEEESSKQTVDPSAKVRDRGTQPRTSTRVGDGLHSLNHPSVERSKHIG